MWATVNAGSPASGDADLFSRLVALAFSCKICPGLNLSRGLLRPTLDHAHMVGQEVVKEKPERRRSACTAGVLAMRYGPLPDEELALARPRRLMAAKTWGEYLMTAQGRRA